MTTFANGKTVNDLVRIAAAGGGFEMSPLGRSTEDLIRIAAAASSRGCRITIRGIRGRTINELIRIGAAGKGAVFFVD